MPWSRIFEKPVCGGPIRSRTIDCDPSEEKFLRRLGGAIVVQWDSLTDLEQGVLLTQACLIDIPETSDDFMKRLKLFIAKISRDVSAPKLSTAAAQPTNLNIS